MRYEGLGYLFFTVWRASQEGREKREAALALYDHARTEDPHNVVGMDRFALLLQVRALSSPAVVAGARWTHLGHEFRLAGCTGPVC
jgi:hypothetical protein